jgi:adenylosuccinate lyase
MENVALWHERDISHSSVERVIIPDSTILVDFMLARFTDLIAKLVVYPERMRRNIEMTGGVIYSQRLMLELVRQGASRVQAYEVVQRLAMAAWQGRTPFKDLVEKDPVVTKHLSAEAIHTCFNPKAYTRYVPEIFKRVFGNGGKPRTRKGRRPA